MTLSLQNKMKRLTIWISNNHICTQVCNTANLTGLLISISLLDFVRISVLLSVSYYVIYFRRLSAPCLSNNYSQRKQDTPSLSLLTPAFLIAFGFFKNIYGPNQKKNALLSRTVFCREFNPTSGNFFMKPLSLNKLN